MSHGSMRRWTVPRLVLSVVVVSTIVTGFATAGGSVAWARGATPSAPTITQQPQPVAAKFGKTATFHVKADGSPKPSLQWQVSSAGGAYVDIGSPSAALRVPVTTTVDGNLYRAVATNASGSATSRSATLTIVVSSKDQKVKARISGLFDKGSGAPYQLNQVFPTTPTGELSGYAPAFAGIVVNETWAQLEPVQGQPDFTPLDDSLAAVTAYDNTDPSHPLTVKLRVFGGFTAPTWAKSLDGSPISVPGDSTRPAGGTLGRYWLADYQQQWTDFQAALAQRYDNNDLVSQVAVTSCGTITAEPFVLDGTIVTALTAAGWTQSDQVQCVEGALGNYAAWQRTPIDFTMNPSPVAGATQTVVTRCAQTVITGALPLCILDNHGLTDSVTTQQASLYASIDAAWQLYDGAVPVDFQTIGPNGFNLCTAIGIGVAHHAQSVEVWPPGPGYSGFDAYTPAQLTAWDRALTAGTTPVCS